MNTLQDYLQQLTELRGEVFPEGFKYRCIEEYVQANGVQMLSEPLSSDELDIVLDALDEARAAGYNVREPKQCFANAQLLSMCDASGDLVYHEGYALGRAPIPIHHGWVGIGGKVVDFTWRLSKPVSGSPFPEHPVGRLPEGYSYLGVPFPDTDSLRVLMLQREMLGSLLDDYKSGFPLLQGKPLVSGSCA